MARIGFIGTGNMGGALITAACRGIAPEEVLIADRDQDKAKALAAKTGCRVAKDNLEVAANAEYVVLAVKPNVIRSAAKEIAPVLQRAKEAGEKKIVVTIAAGIAVRTIKDCIETDLPVLRVMPNTPVMVGQGMILLCSSKEDPADVPDEVFSEFQEILKEAGEFERISEDAMDYTTSVSSCSPAFVYMFIDALADGACEVGVPRSQALRLAAKTVLGSAAMVLETGEHPGRLKDNVCSPGGSTIVGVAALEEKGFRSAVAQAVVRSTKKNQELGK